LARDELVLAGFRDPGVGRNRRAAATISYGRAGSPGVGGLVEPGRARRGRRSPRPSSSESAEPDPLREAKHVFEPSLVRVSDDMGSSRLYAGGSCAFRCPAPTVGRGTRARPAGDGGGRRAGVPLAGRGGLGEPGAAGGTSTPMRRFAAGRLGVKDLFAGWRAPHRGGLEAAARDAEWPEGPRDAARGGGAAEARAEGVLEQRGAARARVRGDGHQTRSGATPDNPRHEGAQFNGRVELGGGGRVGPMVSALPSRAGPTNRWVRQGARGHVRGGRVQGARSKGAATRLGGGCGDGASDGGHVGLMVRKLGRRRGPRPHAVNGGARTGAPRGRPAARGCYGRQGREGDGPTREVGIAVGGICRARLEASGLRLQGVEVATERQGSFDFTTSFPSPKAAIWTYASAATVGGDHGGATCGDGSWKGEAITRGPSNRLRA